MNYMIEQLPGDTEIDNFDDLKKLNYQKMFLDDHMLDPVNDENMENHI